MLIIIDGRLPAGVAQNLQQYGDIFQLESFGIVYDSISGHPDIFLFQKDHLVIVAPNAPKALIEALKKHRIPFLRGKEKLGMKFPETAYYNAVSNSKYFIHRRQYSSNCMLRQTTDKQFLPVPQAYTRCNLLALPDGSFITSDRGIEESLIQNGLEVHYFDPSDILLNGQEHGFIGGAMSVYKNNVFIIGGLENFRHGKELAALLQSKSLKINELYNGPLIDGGGIFFLEE